MTGDPQKGVWPPRDRPLSGLLRQDTLDDRLRAEVPDRARSDYHPALLIDNESETGDDIDAEPPVAVDRDTDSYTGEKI